MPDPGPPLHSSRAQDAFAGRHVLICGASGNLGSHLAQELASLGACLTLWGRRRDVLDRLAQACSSAAHRTATTRCVDIADTEAALAALRETDDHLPIDAAFFIAGVGDTREPERRFESPALIAKLGLVNYIGPATLAAELGERMTARGKGRIVLVGSAAATHPLPFAAGYASSKSGLSLFAECLRLAVKPHGVSVTLASPGFFNPAPAGPAHTYSRPGEVSPALVAARLIMAAATGKPEVVTPRWFLLLRWLGIVLPRPLRDRLLTALPAP